jgi:hypothetical protein
MDITLEGGKRLSARLDHMGPAIRTAARRQLVNIGAELARYGQQHFEESGLKRRSGNLAVSMAVLPVEEDEHSITGGMMVGKGLKYAKAQEYGAEIDAQSGHMLAIPMEDALTPAGAARFAPRDAQSEGCYDRIFFSNVGSNVYMFGVKDGIVHLLFVLVHHVSIPARPFAGPALDANRAWIESRLKQAVDEGIKESGE